MDGGGWSSRGPWDALFPLFIFDGAAAGGIETIRASVRTIRGDSVVGNLLEGLFELLRIGRHVAHWGWMAVESAEC